MGHEHGAARETLWKQAEWLRVTLASIGDAVVTTDTEGRVLSLNPEAEKLTGWRQEEAEGRLLDEVFRIIHEQTREPAENPAKQALETGRIVRLTNHSLLVSRSGAETPIDDSAAPIRDDQGRVHGVVLVFRSVAETRRAEEALRRSERELAEFFENATVGLQWTAEDGTILRVNRATLEMLGYSSEEYLGRHVADFHIDRDVIDDILRRLEAGETLRDVETRWRCRDDSIKHLLLDWDVLREDGRFVHTRCFMRDITDRKRAEEVQARLAAIVESSQDAIIGKTLDSRIVSWNAGAQQLFGYRASEMVGRSVTVLIPPERQDEEAAILERLRRGERIEHYETVRVAKGGARIDVSLTISPIRDAAGRIVGASKIARDVGARKRAQQRLAMQYDVSLALTESGSVQEAAPRILRAICEHLGWQVGALWRVDRREGVLRCLEFHRAPDASVERFEAMTREAAFRKEVGLPGRVWASRQPMDIPDVVTDENFPRARIARAEGLHGALGFPITLHDDVTGVIEFFSPEIRPPDPDLLQVMSIIGSQIGQFFERKRTEDEQRRAEQTSRFLADASAALSLQSDPESTLRKVASLAVPDFADWCAVDVREADGSARRLLDPGDAPQSPDAPGAAARVIRGGKTEWDDSYICVPLRTREHVLGAFSFAAAGSGRRFHAEDARAAEDLAHRVVIAIENTNLLVALRVADRRKDEFLAMLAHELRNPLAPIANAVQILRARGTQLSELHWANEVIDRQVKQMTRLVDDLLDVSRITRGKIELRRQFVELSGVVSSAVEASRPLIEKRQHRLSIDLPEQPIRFEADPARVAQVLSNLLNNAAKYTDPGGRIQVSAERQGDQVAIRVRDSGIGIRAADLTQIFDLFTQADGSERAQGGLGIGLTLVQRLVEMHGGSVEARSEGPGLGSEFVVRLPLTRLGAEVAPREASAGESAGASAACRILVVDDNRDAADSLAMLLRRKGNEVRTANDGLEAVEAAASFAPHAVLLDVGLPKLSGYEAARRIRAQERGDQMLLIAVTGWGQEEDLRRSLEAGFDHHLTKPVDFEALHALLAGWRLAWTDGRQPPS